MYRYEVKIFASPEELSGRLADEFAAMAADAKVLRKPLNVALSGGNTPRLFFLMLAEKYSNLIDWNFINFFWGDERCVPPGDKESNYGMTREILLNKLTIPSGNIHRIRGEEDPLTEVVRYSELLRKKLITKNNIPSFDLNLLGMGEDGHTASIFQGHTGSFNSDEVCEVAEHPVTGQKRITISGKVINNSEKVIFMVSGENKSNVIENIFKKNDEALQYPASYVNPESGKLTWMLDRKAAVGISQV